MPTELEQLRYPIGKFVKPEFISEEDLRTCILTIAEFPAILRRTVQALNHQQLNTPYREGGWTIRQVVHHCADSHMNALIRFKLALTEDSPTIRPYKEDLWAELGDYKMDLSASLLTLEGVHQHMVNIWSALNADTLKRIYVHPEYGTTFSLAQAMVLYDWHCKHHLAHITTLLKKKGW